MAIFPMQKQQPREQDESEKWERSIAGNVGGAAGWAAGFAASGKLAHRVEGKVRRKTAARVARVLRTDKLPQAINRNPLGSSLGNYGNSVARAQARGIGRVAGIAAAGAVRGTAAMTGGILGDAAGDLAAGNRRSLRQDGTTTAETRKMSMMGAGLGAALGMGAQLAIEGRRGLRYRARRKLAAGIAAGAGGGFAGERLGDIQSSRIASDPQLQRLGKSSTQLSDAQIQQRRDAARARWAGHTPAGEGQAGERPRKPWTGERLGVGRGMKVQASSTLAPVWRSNYDGAEWGYSATGPEKDGATRIYSRFDRKPQIPPGMSEAEYVKLGQWAVGRSRELKDAIIAEGIAGDRKKKRYPTIPADKIEDRRAISDAFNHARELALHDVGLWRVRDFSMTPEAKAKLAGMEPFIWRARRQLSNPIREERKETWAATRAQHGMEFTDGRTYRHGTKGGRQQGDKKKRFERHSVLVKRWAGALCQAPGETP